MAFVAEGLKITFPHPIRDIASMVFDPGFREGVVLVI